MRLNDNPTVPKSSNAAPFSTYPLASASQARIDDNPTGRESSNVAPFSTYPSVSASQSSPDDKLSCQNSTNVAPFSTYPSASASQASPDDNPTSPNSSNAAPFSTYPNAPNIHFTSTHPTAGTINCGYCTTKYSRQHELTKHMRRNHPEHAAEEAYVCPAPGCPRGEAKAGFRYPSAVRKHYSCRHETELPEEIRPKTSPSARKAKAGQATDPDIGRVPDK